MKRLNALAGARGFTLVEVLVALLVMAVMAGMAWQGVDGIVRSRRYNSFTSLIHLSRVIYRLKKSLIITSSS